MDSVWDQGAEEDIWAPGKRGKREPEITHQGPLWFEFLTV
jgi:hypothetical protein